MKKIKKSFIVALVFVLLIALIFLLVSDDRLLQQLYDLEAETAVEFAYVKFDKLYIGELEIDFNAILNIQRPNARFLEAFAVLGDDIWFAYRDVASEAETINIASVNIKSHALTVKYSCDFENVGQYYCQSNINVEYQSETYGYYREGHIILTNQFKQIDYDIGLDSASVLTGEEYARDDSALYATIHNNHRQINFTKGSEEKEFFIFDEDNSSAAVSILRTMEHKKTWDGSTERLTYLIDGVQVAGDDVYIICRVLDYWGNTHAVTFLYDFERNEVEYIFATFMFDVILNRLYFVEVCKS